MAQCGTCVSRLYKSVIEEVIAGVKESFLDEGIDDQVLTDLKLQWEAKLAATKAADHSEVTLQHQQQQQNSNQQQHTQPAPTTASAVQAVALVPIQITIPSQQAGGVAKTITIHAPSSALAAGIAGPQLQSILSSPAAAQTFALETAQAAEIIQRQLNAALQQNGVILPPQLLQYNNPVSTQVDGPADTPLPSNSFQLSSPSTSKKGSCHTKRRFNCDDIQVKVNASVGTMDGILDAGLRASQMDGAHGLGDSSDEMSDDDDDDDDEDDDKGDEHKTKDEDDDDEDAEDDFLAEDPLNSNDDVSDDDNTDVFETDNVVVCQYDKITRVRNKWKFHLKDGIMNLKSRDYVFTKASGEGEW